MGLKKVFLGLAIILSVFACKKTEQLGNVNLENFRKDRGGCKNLRQAEIEHLTAVQDSLLGKSENEIFNILGRYDLQILDRRQKKVFVYSLEQGDQCNGDRSFPNNRTLSLRFNAVSLVNEVSIQTGMP